MNTKFICAILIVFTVCHGSSSAKYNHTITIGNCSFSSYYDGYGLQHELILICNDQTEQELLKNQTDSWRSSCEYALSNKGHIGSIQFKNCDQPKILSSILSEFQLAHTFDMSNLGLTSLHLINELYNVKRLNLTHNRIQSLSAENFKYLEKLTHFDASSNLITTLEPSTFEQQRNLRVLSLADNFISEIDGKLFENISKIEYLNISHNRLSELKPGIFLRLRYLKVLDLSYNELKVLRLNIWPSTLTHFEILDIGANQMTKFEVFNNFVNRKLNITGIEKNNFRCAHYIKLYETLWSKGLRSIPTPIGCFLEENEKNEVRESDEFIETTALPITEMNAPAKIQSDETTLPTISLTQIPLTISEESQHAKQSKCSIKASSDEIEKDRSAVNLGIDELKSIKEHLAVISYAVVAIAIGLFAIVTALTWIFMQTRRFKMFDEPLVHFKPSDPNSINTVEK